MADEATGATETAGENQDAETAEQGGTTILTDNNEAADKDDDAEKQESKDAGEGDENKDKAGEKDGDPLAEVPESPDGYDLKFTEKTQVDTALLGDFTKAAHELGINRGQAQKLAEMYEGRISVAKREYEQRQADHQKATLDKWEGEIKSSPTFNEDVDHARAVLRQFGDKEVSELLDGTYLGSHPRFFKFMASVGKALAEPGFKGEGVKGNKSDAEVLYPNMA